MKVILVTHPEARKPKKGFFRNLSSQGQSQATEVAKRIKKFMADEGNGTTIRGMVSSPASRAVDTLLTVADNLTELTVADNLPEPIEIDRIVIEESVAEATVSYPRLREALRHFKEFKQEDIVLVALHADAAAALPEGSINPNEAPGGWFADRPVLLVMEVDMVTNTPPRLILGEKLTDTGWVTLQPG